MLYKPKSLFLILSLLFSCINAIHAAVFVIPENGDLIGEVQHTFSRIGETIDEVGRRYNMGYHDMVRANPRIDAIHQLAPRTSLIVPSQFILPKVPRQGIVINLAEYRLYYFPPNENVVITFPVGIGREGWHTPIGVTKVTAKIVNPVWRPTANVMAAAEEIGAPLPSVFPAGPSNPLGKHVLRLGWPTFLIHGTNRVDGVGARVSAGCIRMLPDDIEQLYSLVATGTPVRVINEPVKIGMQDGAIYLQLHPVLRDQHSDNLRALLDGKMNHLNIKKWTENQAIQKELIQPTGLAFKISV